LSSMLLIVAGGEGRFPPGPTTAESPRTLNIEIECAEELLVSLKTADLLFHLATIQPPSHTHRHYQRQQHQLADRESEHELLSNVVDRLVSGGGLGFESVDELNSGNHVGQELGAV